MMRSYLFSSGSNAHGQLGTGTVSDCHAFDSCSFNIGSSKSLSISDKILHIASGANHTLLLSESPDGKWLWGSGDGSSGQLGNCGRHGEDETELKRIDLQLGQNGLEGYEPRLICSSWETSYVVLSCEECPEVLISMGSNDFGDLGVGQNLDTKLFHTVKFDHLRVDGLSMDKSSLRFLSISAGQHHFIAQISARLSDQSHRNLIVGWGSARHGQLGDTSGLTKKTPFFSLPKIIEMPYPADAVVSVALGNQHSVFCHASGRLSCLGSNKKSQLVGIDTFRDVSFVGCTWNGTYFLDSGALYATGSHSKGQLGRDRSLLPDSDSTSLPILPRPVELSFNVVSPEHLKIACGSEHVLALRTDGVPAEVLGWGWNEHGNLGLGTTEDVYTPSKLWPLEKLNENAEITGIWAGCGTSWIAIVLPLGQEP